MLKVGIGEFYVGAAHLVVKIQRKLSFHVCLNVESSTILPSTLYYENPRLIPIL